MNTQSIESLRLFITRELDIEAAPTKVFDSVLEELGPGSQTPDGKTLSMKLEAWPGGRWFRDLGGNSGHLWGHVQVIKPPALIELCGPMFMSYAAINHVQYRLTEQPRGTRLTFTHRAFGDIQPDHREGVKMGWELMINRIADRARRFADSAK